MKTAINFINVSKIYRDGFIPQKFSALQNISFQVPKGSCIAYLGPNGAGKTTTIKLMLNLIHPTTGTISIFDQSVASGHTRKFIGYVSDHPYFYNHLSLDEYMDFAADLYNLDKIDKKDRIATVLDMVHLSDFRSMPLRKFSRGMGQRLSFAQAMLHDPELIIMDEPLNGLDPFGRKDLRDIILSFKNRNKTIFFSSHILEDAELVADEVIFINKGKILFNGNPDELRQTGEKQFKIILHNNNSAIHKLPPLPSGIRLKENKNLIEISGINTSVLGSIIRFSEENGLVISEISELNQPLEQLFMDIYRKEADESH